MNRRTWSFIVFIISFVCLFLVFFVARSEKKPSLSSLRKAYDGLGDDEEID